VTAAQRFSVPRLVATILTCAVLLAVALVLGVSFGGEPVSLTEAFTDDGPAAAILFSLRIPRVVLAALVGAALAASGSTLQALMRNPLADPFVLGVSGGSALGATIALALGISSLAALPGLSAASALALLGALAATVLVMMLGRLAGGGSPHTTLLAGVIFNAFALAAIIFIKALVAPDKVGEVLFWLAGALGYEKPTTLWATGLVQLLAIGTMWALAGRLNLMTLGDEDAASLGVDVARTRALLLFLASLSVSAAVALSGLVGFVGLLVPHLARLALGPDQRLLLPASALLGASFLVLADLAARVLFRVFHTEPPVGVITALLGGPLFMLLLVRSARLKTA
jgi:iron complex transport system permease protein